MLRRAPSLPVFFLALALLAPSSRAQKVPPVDTGSNYKLTAGASVLVAGPGQAGRIRSLRHEGAELLYVSTSGGDNWGSTLWPSPQAYWTSACKNANPPNAGCWPPPASLDGASLTYTGGRVNADTTLVFAGSATDANTGLRFRKTYSANADDSSFSLVYTLLNASASPVAFAPWEITRFTTGGLTFYPPGLDTVKGNHAAMRAMARDTLGARWFKYDSAAIPTTGTAKIWDDAGAAGWFAHVDKSRLLFIKKFTDTPRVKNAPANTNEGEVEIYSAPRSGTSGGMAYMEMELQGRFDTIPAGDSTRWHVKWYVRRLPDGMPVTRNAALLAFVNAVITRPVSVHGRANPPFDAFNASARLRLSGDRVTLSVDAAAVLSLSLVNARGATVRRLHGGPIAPGSHAFALTGLPRGVYRLILKNHAGDIVETGVIPRL